MPIVVGTNHHESVGADVQWWKNVYPQYHCPSCRGLDLTLFPRPIDAYLKTDPGHRVTGLVSFTRIAIFHRDFVMQIAKHLDGFALGKVYGPEQTINPLYQTCYTDSIIVLRGDRNAKYYVCKECGWVKLNMGGQRHRYILKKHLPRSFVFQVDTMDLLLAEDLADLIDWSPWPDVRLDKVKVIDRPFDKHRLPGDPDWDAM